jgi:hypothetical protein
MAITIRRIWDKLNNLSSTVNDLNTGNSNLITADLSTGGFTGDKLVVGGSTAGTIAAGQLVYLSSSSVWTLAAANDTGVGEDEILGIALSASPNSAGVLTSGIFKLSTSYISGGAFTVGAQVYMHPSTAGSYTSTRPSSSGQIVRVVGHAVATDIIYFNPSPDYVEL